MTERIADNGQLTLAPEMALRRVVLKAGKRDTVASVARRYGLSAAKVAEWNNVSAMASFKPGQHIVVHRWMPMNSGGAHTPLRRTPTRMAKR